MKGLETMYRIRQWINSKKRGAGARAKPQQRLSTRHFHAFKNFHVFKMSSGGPSSTD